MGKRTRARGLSSRWWQGAVAVFLLVAISTTLPDAQQLPPQQPGPYSVARYSYYPWWDLYIGSLTITYPVGPGTSGVKFPGIVFAPGFASGAGAPWLIWGNDYDWVPDHLATHGYIVLTFTPTDPVWIDVFNIVGQWAEGIRSGIDELEAENGWFFSPIYGKLDESKIGAMGVSMGGAGAIQAAGTDSRIDAIAPLAPGNVDIDLINLIFEQVRIAARDITVPTQIHIGSRDCIVTTNGALDYYNEIGQATKALLEIHGANHVNYLDEGSLGEVWGEIVDCDATITVEKQHRLSRKYFTAWFEYYLKNRTEFEPWVKGGTPGTGVDQDLADGDLKQFRFSDPSDPGGGGGCT